MNEQLSYLIVSCERELGNVTRCLLAVLKPNARNHVGSPILCVAAFRGGSGPALQALLTAGTDVKLVDRDGQSAMHISASFGLMEALRTLLEHNAPLDCSDKEGWTPLMCAAETGQTDAVALLLVELGARSRGERYEQSG